MNDYQNLLSLQGKTALVTGAARGIGAEVASALSQMGARVLLTDREEAAVKATAASISAAGGQAEGLAHDVTSEAQWIAAIEAVQSRFGGLDILVNNAGIETAALLTQCTLEDFRQVMDVNVSGVFLGMKHAVPAMGQGGAIVNLASVAGLIGTSGHIAYHASKGGVRMLTRAAAVECAQLQTGIRVNAVYPAIVQTEMGDDFIKHLVALGLAPDVETARAALEAGHLLGLGEPADVAAAVLYLASDAAKWITGTELVLDGGYTAV